MQNGSGLGIERMRLPSGSDHQLLIGWRMPDALEGDRKQIIRRIAVTRHPSRRTRRQREQTPGAWGLGGIPVAFGRSGALDCEVGGVPVVQQTLTGPHFRGHTVFVQKAQHLSSKRGMRHRGTPTQSRAPSRPANSHEHRAGAQPHSRARAQ